VRSIAGTFDRPCRPSFVDIDRNDREVLRLLGELRRCSVNAPGRGGVGLLERPAVLRGPVEVEQGLMVLDPPL